MKKGDVAELKTIKDYVLMKGELYHKMPRKILSKCVRHKEVQRKIEEVHSKICGFHEVSLYQRLQKASYH